MSLALHGHHTLIVAALAFVTAVLTPNWYINDDKTIAINVFQICNRSQSHQDCQWTLSSEFSSTLKNNNLQIIYPILVASFAIFCGLTSIIGLFLGSWYLQKTTSENKAIWLLTLATIIVLLTFFLSCAVWIIMLTINLQHHLFNKSAIRLEQFDFSFWISIGSSGAYFYVFIIYLIEICKNR